MPAIKIDDIEMYYEEHGAGYPFYLITGVGGLGGGWGPQIPLFAKGYRTIVPDHRGTGRTTIAEGGYTIRQLAGDMASLLRSLKATPAHIVGASTGGAIGQVMALEHPDTVRSLVLVGTWGRTDHYFRRQFEVRKQILQQMGPQAYAEASNLFLYAPGYIREQWDQFLAAEGRMKANPPNVAAAVKRIDMIIAHDILDRVKDIRQPACIVVGAQDACTPVYFSEELKRHMPGAELVVIEGAGHFAYLEKPEAFFQPVRRFLDRLSRA
jgi:aminoacrylate hydrolase